MDIYKVFDEILMEEDIDSVIKILIELRQDPTVSCSIKPVMFPEYYAYNLVVQDYSSAWTLPIDRETYYKLKNFVEVGKSLSELLEECVERIEYSDENPRFNIKADFADMFKTLGR